MPATLGGGGIGVGLGEPSVALGLNEGGRYVSQVWEDGTVCDMTGIRRRTEVQVSRHFAVIGSPSAAGKMRLTVIVGLVPLQYSER